MRWGPHDVWIDYGNCMIHSHLWTLEQHKSLAPFVITENKLKNVALN